MKTICTFRVCGNSCTWAQTVHHVPKCMSCHKVIVVITGWAHCFHDYIYIMPILLLRYLSFLCVVDHVWPLIYKSTYIYDHLYIFIYKLIFIFILQMCLLNLPPESIFRKQRIPTHKFI